MKLSENISHMRILVLIFITSIAVSCVHQKVINMGPGNRLHFIGEYDIPHNTQFQNTTVGGLSGIDYDGKRNVYYLVSDDRSAINPARFYTAKIHLNEKSIDSVELIAVTNMLQPSGATYPNSKQDPFHTPDPEAMRYDAKKSLLVWSSEGERIIRKDSAILEDPAVFIINKDGRFVDSFLLPSNMHMRSSNSGPRQNGVFEGLSFFNNYKELMVSVEEPLYEDGARAGIKDSSAWIRWIRFDARSKKPFAQYAYRIDPVAYPSNPPGAFKINGVPDILALNDHQFLVIERSFSTGRKPCTIKVYLADISVADNIFSLASLQERSFVPITKRLLLNMDDLGIYTDNIEGVCLGPKLPNGRQSLIFVADNNFSADEITQFLLFEIR